MQKWPNAMNKSRNASCGILSWTQPLDDIRVAAYHRKIPLESCRVALSRHQLCSLWLCHGRSTLANTTRSSDIVTPDPKTLTRSCGGLVTQRVNSTATQKGLPEPDTTPPRQLRSPMQSHYTPLIQRPRCPSAQTSVQFGDVEIAQIPRTHVQQTPLRQAVLP